MSFLTQQNYNHAPPTTPRHTMPPPRPTSIYGSPLMNKNVQDADDSGACMIASTGVFGEVVVALEPKQPHQRRQFPVQATASTVPKTISFNRAFQQQYNEPPPPPQPSRHSLDSYSAPKTISFDVPKKISFGNVFESETYTPSSQNHAKPSAFMTSGDVSNLLNNGKTVRNSDATLTRRRSEPESSRCNLSQEREGSPHLTRRTSMPENYDTNQQPEYDAPQHLQQQARRAPENIINQTSQYNDPVLSQRASADIKRDQQLLYGSTMPQRQNLITSTRGDFNKNQETEYEEFIQFSKQRLGNRNHSQYDDPDVIRGPQNNQPRWSGYSHSNRQSVYDDPDIVRRFDNSNNNQQRTPGNSNSYQCNEPNISQRQERRTFPHSNNSQVSLYDIPNIPRQQQRRTSNYNNNNNLNNNEYSDPQQSQARFQVRNNQQSQYEDPDAARGLARQSFSKAAPSNRNSALGRTISSPNVPNSSAPPPLPSRSPMLMTRKSTGSLPSMSTNVQPTRQRAK